jgi:signal transduction histidine kinase
MKALVGETDHSLELLDTAVTRTRQLTVDLNPPVLDGEGLVGALQWLQTQMRDLYGLDVSLRGPT